MKNLIIHQKNPCCFTGHKILSKDTKEIVITQLNHESERLMKLRVNIYYSRGALGFDQIAASLIIKKETRDN